MRGLQLYIYFAVVVIVLIISIKYNNTENLHLCNSTNKLTLDDVPKNIIMVVTGEITPFVAENIESLKAKNKNWKLHLYRDMDIEPFIYQHYNSDVVTVYKSINPLYGAARADFFRYLALYALGGVYLDSKSSCEYPLDETVLSGDVDIILWNSGHRFPNIHCECSPHPQDEFCNWVLIAPQHSPLIKQVIDDVIYNLRNKNGSGWDILKITGPHQFTSSICSLLTQYKWSMRNEKQSGFVYCRDEDEYRRQNKSIRRKHWSELKEPIILANV